MFTSHLLHLATFLLLLYPPVHPTPSTCTSPPAWSFYDIVSHLATISLDDTNSTSLFFFGNSSNSSATVATPTNITTSPITFHYNANQTILEDVVVRQPIPAFYRQPFGDIRDNVTLVVLTNSQEHRLRNEQQIYNLEQIYRSLVGVHLANIRFLLVNAKEAFNPRWVWETRRRVSFDVFQELPTSPIIGHLLDGSHGDIFIYDRCGLLTYYIPFPLSFIHTQQPILQAAILATYFDSPCKASCSSNVTANANASSVFNGTTTPSPTTVPSISLENATTVSIEELPGNVANQTTSTTTNATETTGYNDMGQILMKFFGQIVPALNDTSANGTTTIEAPIDQSTSSQIATSNATVAAATNATNTPTQAPTRAQNILDRLRLTTPPPTSTTSCNANVCSEWSTEKLLKARLCCLHSQAEEDIDPAGSTRVVNLTSNEATSEPTEVVDGGFGCQLYARRRCNRIMPLIKCCLRKVLSKYFDFTIRLREQQQRMAQFGTSSLLANAALARAGGTVGSVASLKDPAVLEYPADYVLGVKQTDYFKQQHRKRVNRRVVVAGSGVEMLQR